VLLAILLSAALLGSLFLAQQASPRALPIPANPTPAISSEQAAALAVNQLNATASGYTLHNPRHTATFAPQGLTFAPHAGDLDWHWSLTQAGNAATGAPLAAVEHGDHLRQHGDRLHTSGHGQRHGQLHLHRQRWRPERQRRHHRHGCAGHHAARAADHRHRNHRYQYHQPHADHQRHRRGRRHHHADD
jgi:hypothetical protein